MFQAGVPNARTVRVGVEETTRVVTEASISGRVDDLRELKENAERSERRGAKASPQANEPAGVQGTPAIKLRWAA